MRLNGIENEKHSSILRAIPALCGMALLAFANHVTAQTKPAGSESSQTTQASTAEMVQTIFLSNAIDHNDLNDIATDLRNVIPRAKIFAVQGQNAITLLATEEQLATAQKLVADLDKPRKLYRLTYTITNYEDGKRTGSERYVFVATAGMKTVFKEGDRIPLVTGTTGKETAEQSSAIQYQDIGLSIEARITGSPENLMLYSKVEQSSLADEKSATTPADPVVHQAVLEGDTGIVGSKPAVIGSLDLPGTTRRQEIEVVAEAVR